MGTARFQYFCNLLHALVLEQHIFNRFIKTYICARDAFHENVAAAVCLQECTPTRILQIDYGILESLEVGENLIQHLFNITCISTPAYLRHSGRFKHNFCNEEVSFFVGGKLLRKFFQQLSLLFSNMHHHFTIVCAQL